MKEDYAFVVMDGDGAIDGGERGLYSHDTRFLNRYVWQIGDGFQTLVRHSDSPDRYFFYYSHIEGPSQRVGVSRELRLGPTLLEDVLTVENTHSQSTDLNLRLHIAADFIDMFEARGFEHRGGGEISNRERETALDIRYVSAADLEMGITITALQGAPTQVERGCLSFEFTLEAGARRTLHVRTDLQTGVATYQSSYSYHEWRRGFPTELTDASRDWQRALVLSRAIDDLRALLLNTAAGPVSAAGIPWFVATFGRDSIITAYLLLPHHPALAEATLKELAAMQGSRVDLFHAEEPGKIPHERRFGELTRLGVVPHSPYYGTIDATPLFLVLLERLYRQTGNEQLLRELRPVWEAALRWILDHAMTDGRFLRYVGAAPGQGLVVQSWKDSDDSMSHANGTLATGAIAPVEVQGYGYAAFRAAEGFYRALAEDQKARDWARRAEDLAAAIDEHYWLDERGTYAMALDGDDQPLRVKSSNAGHLLWSGAVRTDRAARLVETLVSPELWSGWGIRTLGNKEARYNPVSYHNGSVWPHDNALIAAGFARYGFRDYARRIRDALFDLAESQEDHRLPELIAGYPRRSGPPIPYPVACRPQAWDAAALIYLDRL
jgi:glycogen debranching enzyme